MEIEELIDELIDAVVKDVPLPKKSLLFVAAQISKIRRLEEENEFLREAYGWGDD